MSGRVEDLTLAELNVQIDITLDKIQVEARMLQQFFDRGRNVFDKEQTNRRIAADLQRLAVLHDQLATRLVEWVIR